MLAPADKCLTGTGSPPQTQMGLECCITDAKVSDQCSKVVELYRSTATRYNPTGLSRHDPKTMGGACLTVEFSCLNAPRTAEAHQIQQQKEPEDGHTALFDPGRAPGMIPSCCRPCSTQ
jgi:hypothetical protein